MAGINSNSFLGYGGGGWMKNFQFKMVIKRL